MATPNPKVGHDNSGPLRLTKDALKRSERVWMEYRHRELAISVEGSTLSIQGSKPDHASLPTACRISRGPWIATIACVKGDAPANVDRIHSAVERFGSHLQDSPAGQLWICKRSPEEFKEKL